MNVFAVSREKVDIGRLVFTPDGSLLVAQAGGVAAAPWCVGTGERVAPGQGPDFSPGYSAAVHPSGRWLVGTGFGGRFVVYDAQKGQNRRGPMPPEDVWYVHPRFTPDGKKLVHYFHGRGEAPPGLMARKWSPKGLSEPLWTAPLDAERPGSWWCKELVPLADGKRFVTVDVYGECGPSAVGDHRRLTLRSVATGEVLARRPFGGIACSVYPELAVAPDASRFVVGVARHLYVWTGFDPTEECRRVTNDGKKHFTAVAFHPFGRFLAAASNDATVKLYDTATWQVARTFTWNIGRMRSVALSPDGTLAAAGSDTGKVVVWDLDV